MQPLAENLVPYLKERNMIEIPIFYMDHLDLIDQMTGFRLEGLGLDKPGLKVFDFHPNMVYLNAQDNDHYMDSKVDYHNPAKLRERRRQGRGVRTLFLELLDALAGRRENCLADERNQTTGRCL